MKKTISTITAGLAIAALTAAPAYAADVTSTATIKNTPDDGNPPWARDTFTRTTTITETGENTYQVQFADNGTFRTAKKADNAKTPGTDDGDATIQRRVEGTLEGSGEFTVTGELKGSTALGNLDGRTYGFGQFATKNDVPADKRTGSWWKKFFKAGAASDGIKNWQWVYKTACEEMTQTPAGVEGNIVGEKCSNPEPEFTPSAITAQAKCRIAGTTQQTWNLARVPGSEEKRKVTAIGWVYYPNSKYDKAHGTDNPNDGWTYLGDISVPENVAEHTITTPYGGGLSVHYWNGKGELSKLWTKSNAQTVC